MLRTLHRLRRSRSYNKICNSSSSDEDSSLGSPSRESSIDEEDYENWKTKYNLIGGVLYYLYVVEDNWFDRLKCISIKIAKCIPTFQSIAFLSDNIS